MRTRRPPLRTERDDWIPFGVEEALRTDLVVPLPVPGAEARGFQRAPGTKVPITPRRVLVFRPSNIMKERINAGPGKRRAAE